MSIAYPEPSESTEVLPLAKNTMWPLDSETCRRTPGERNGSNGLAGDFEVSCLHGTLAKIFITFITEVGGQVRNPNSTSFCK